jgi:hypothetical protein
MFKLFSEYFDEIVRFECTLIGAGMLSTDHTLVLKCSRLVLYDGHPLKEEVGETIEGKEIHFIFRSAFCGKMRIRPFEQEFPFKSGKWLPEKDILVIPSDEEPIVTKGNCYDMSEFLIINPCEGVRTASIQEWIITADEFVLQIEI